MPSPNNYPISDAQLLAALDQHVFTTPPPGYTGSVQTPQPQPALPPGAAEAAGNGDRGQSSDGNGVLGFRGEDDRTQPQGSDDTQEHYLRTSLIIAGLIAGLLGGAYVAYKESGFSGGNNTAHNSRLQPPSHAATTVVPHTSVVPSATPSPTISSSSSPSSPASPVAIPKFDLSGFTIPCETIATVTVNEKVPIGVVEKFTSLLGTNQNTVNDPNNYSLAPKSNGAADANVAIAPATPIPIQLCVKSAADVFKPEASAPAGTYPYSVNRAALVLQPDFTSLSNNLAPKPTILSNNVPSVLKSLATPNGQIPKNPTPIEAEATAEEKDNWTDTSQKPNAPIYQQFQGVLASNAKNLDNGALAEMLGQIDDQKAILDQAATDHLRTDLLNYAQTWTANERKTLHTTNVQVPNVSLDASGDVASMRTAFLKENPAAATSTAEGLLTYILNNPTIKGSKTPPTDLSSAIAAYDNLPAAAKNPLPPYVEPAPLNNGSNSLTVTPVNPTPAPVPSSAVSSPAPANVTPTGQN